MKGVWLVVLCVLLVGVECKKTSATKIAAKRLQGIKARRANSQTRIISLDESIFNRFVVKEPRGYYTLILFNQDEAGCAICGAFTETMQTVAQLHHEQFVRTNKSDNLFFTLATPQNVMVAFQQYGIQGIPTILMIPPSGIEMTQEFVFHATGIDSFTDPKDICAFISHHLGEEIEVPLPFHEQLIFRQALFAIIALVAIWRLGVVLSNFRHPMLWYTIGLVVYGFVLSGSVFNAMRDAPFLYSAGGMVRLFAPGLRSQFGAEGLIVTGVFLILAALWILLTNVHKVQGNWRRKGAFVLLLVIWFYTLNWITRLFGTVKLQGYPWFYTGEFIAKVLSGQV